MISRTRYTRVYIELTCLDIIQPTLIPPHCLSRLFPDTVTVHLRPPAVNYVISGIRHSFALIYLRNDPRVFRVQTLWGNKRKERSQARRLMRTFCQAFNCAMVGCLLHVATEVAISCQHTAVGFISTAYTLQQDWWI